MDSSTTETTHKQDELGNKNEDEPIGQIMSQTMYLEQQCEKEED